MTLAGFTDRLPAALAPDVLARADRFAFPHDRRRYVAAHGALRAILGGYLNTTPAGVPIRYTPQGKPYLAPPSSDIRFNLSHSGELALIAVTRGREVGVDVERIRPVSAWREIAAKPSRVAAWDFDGYDGSRGRRPAASASRRDFLQSSRRFAATLLCETKCLNTFYTWLK